MIAAIYIRKSREDKNKPSHRLSVQREQLPAHARAQGWQVEVYDDGDASAARGKTAPIAVRQLINRLSSAGFAAIPWTVRQRCAACRPFCPDAKLLWQCQLHPPGHAAKHFQFGGPGTQASQLLAGV
jgi:hypothetical protein